MVHENDQPMLDQVVDALTDKGVSTQVRESIGRLIELVYEKGQTRGIQAIIADQVKILRGESPLASDTKGVDRG